MENEQELKFYKKSLVVDSTLSMNLKSVLNGFDLVQSGVRQFNVTKTHMSPKHKWHPNQNFTKTQMSTKIQMSQKHKCPENPNVIKTQMSPKCDCPKTQM